MRRRSRFQRHKNRRETGDRRDTSIFRQWKLANVPTVPGCPIALHFLVRFNPYHVRIQKDQNHEDERGLSELEPPMNAVQIEQKSFEMPPRDGFTVTHFITVADIDRSADFYEKVFGGRILSRGDSKGASGHIQIANTWLIVNVGGGPTPDKPTVTLSVPADPDKISSFLNIRVADIQACYKLWKSRGAEFITPPIPKYGEMRCYIRDPDGYIIEVGQSTDVTQG